MLVEDENGNSVFVNQDALGSLFELFANNVKCVLLNACYSEKQAEVINQHINYVIGMSKDIQDSAAIEFAVGFYDVLGAGKTIDEAFKFGKNAVQLYNIPEHLTPILKKAHNRVFAQNSQTDSNGSDAGTEKASKKEVSIRGKRMLVLSVILSLLVLCVTAYVLFHPERNNDFSSIIKKFGYTELRPPTQLVPPGTLIKIVKREPLIIGGIVCPQESSLGEKVKNSLLESDSKMSEVAKHLTGTTNIDPNYLNVLKSNRGFSEIKQIQVNLSNVKIIEIPDDAVINNLKYRSKGCRMAL